MKKLKGESFVKNRPTFIKVIFRFVLSKRSFKSDGCIKISELVLNM